MIVEFRVLAIQKETGHYDTDLLRGIFESDNPTLDVVDHLPPTTAMNVIQDSGWTPTVNEVIETETHILIPYTRK